MKSKNLLNIFDIRIFFEYIPRIILHSNYQYENVGVDDLIKQYIFSSGIENSIDEFGEKLCYCGHTNKCSCSNPDLNLFNESLKNRTIILNDKNNGWIKK
jgi:hypothetical protein